MPSPRFHLASRRPPGVQANRDLEIQVSGREFADDCDLFIDWDHPPPSIFLCSFLQVTRHGLRRRPRTVCGALRWRVAWVQVVPERMPPVNGVHHRISIRSYLRTCSAANSIKRKLERRNSREGKREILLTIKLISFVFTITDYYYYLLPTIFYCCFCTKICRKLQSYTYI